ncbi:MAG: ATP-dependent Clp protease adaptor ClpS [Capnocytophaga sp.]|nr:ATP-dependent Clp protease adaptor ClpS [Capnocytophaga sp.]
MKFHYQEQTDTETLIQTQTDRERTIVLYNDDVNTFDHVIDTLMRVCQHTHEQAEQSALIVHHKGKCDVKSGSYDTLKPMCLLLLDAGLSVEMI